MNTFNDINHLPLRIFNRVVLLNNLFADGGKGAAQDYIDQFSETEKKQMYVMSAYIKKLGVQAVRKEVTKGLQLVGEDYVHDSQ